jgi:hypothetical protein
MIKKKHLSFPRYRPLPPGGHAALTEKEGLGAALCWASVTAALLRRDNAQQQARLSRGT